MRLLTAGSLVRVQLEEPRRSKPLFAYFFFYANASEPTSLRAACGRRESSSDRRRRRIKGARRVVPQHNEMSRHFRRRYWIDVANGRGSSPTGGATSERTLLRSDFSYAKNQSHVPSFLLFRKKARSAQLLTCKRVRDVSLSLPPFCDTGAFGAQISERFISSAPK